jgi:N-acetylmuramoyl-L-alanine amidase
MNDPKWLIVHHTGGTDADPLADSSNQTMEQVDAYHKSKGWDEIGYNWFIEKAGTLKKGRDESKTGAHTIGYNDKSIGICLAGNFDLTLPTDGQVATLKKLLKEKKAQYKIALTNIVPHRAFAQKTCYGNRLSSAWAATLVNEPDSPINPKEEIKKKIVTLLDQL